MVEHTVTLKANAGTFEGLSKQNMQFHQCAAELIDNAIAAKDDSDQFSIHIYINPREDENKIDLYITDDGGGMEFSIFQDALQLGKSATTDSRLNEHGFGLKNSLATLSGGNNDWTMWTSPDGSGDVYKATGPFESTMVVEDSSSFPSEGFLPSPSDLSTLIHVPVRLSFLQTVQGRGAPAKDLNKLRQWLIKHLGVLYRGYLEQDLKNRPARRHNTCWH